jgi:hypothetical protein
MTTDPHAADAPGHEAAVAHHATEDHGEDSGHDDHGHVEEPLGPIDVWAWGAGALGILLGLATVACFVLATGIVTVA